jgi:hypothetical protein
MTESNINIKSENNKIKRKKFFLYSGILAFGMLAASKLPFNLFKSGQTETTDKVSSIKITQNPNAVKRNSRQDNNG